MANEATPMVLDNSTGLIKDFTVADGTAIAKGTICKLTDPNTAIISSAAGDVIAGIAATAKEASDGATTLGLWTRGDFKVYASGAIAVGAPLMSAADANYPNYVKTAAGVVTASGAQIIGYAKETAAAGETFMMRLQL